MIDYTKILIIGIDSTRLLNNPLLTFYREISEETGEHENKKVADYHYCKIIIYDSGIVMFQGSIHMFHNALKGIHAPNHKKKEVHKGFNGNLFTLSNIYEVRTHLVRLFNCNADKMQFQNIELGINTTLLFNPNIFLKGLLFHKSKYFEYRYNNNLAQAVHQRFIFKIYNKSHQYKMNKHTLRVELKVNKIEEIKSLDISTFADINNTTMQKARDMLLRRFDEVVYYDYTIDKKQITNRENRLLTTYSNPRYWIEDLKSNHRDRHKKKLTFLIEKYSENLHQKIRQDIEQKCVMINQEHATTKCVIINHSSIGLNITQTPSENSTRICPITLLDISMQKPDSDLLSNTGFKYYKKNNPKQYAFLVKTLLTGRDNKFEKDIYSRLSKQVRNRFYNNLSLYLLKQPRLF